MQQLRYAVYVRKSTEDEEKQVLSIGAQRDKVQERFGDLNIVRIIEETKSAFEPDKRPEFKSLLDDIDAGIIDGIVSWHPDRLSRNEVDASALTWRIRQGKIKDLKFASFSFDNSPEGIMMLQMTMSQSQYFSAKLSKDVKRGNEKKRQIGGLTSAAPEGYLNNRLNKTVYMDPERFDLIRTAFDLFLTGEYSVQQILAIINNEWGYKTVKRHKIGGTSMSRSTLYKIFRNVRYAGLVPDPYDKDKFYKASFPAMITPEEFDRVQELLGRKGLPRLTEKKQFALRGLINCGDCGCLITAQTKKKLQKDGTIKHHTYYHCTGKRTGCSQKSRYIKEADLTMQISELLDKYELAPELERWALEALRDLAEQESVGRSSIQAMQSKAISNTQNRLDKLLDMATRGLISDTDFKNKSYELKKELKGLLEQQTDSADRAKNWYEFVTMAFAKLTSARDNFAGGDITSRKEILLAIGQNPVLIDGKLSITPNAWLIPVANSVKDIRAQLDMVRTLPHQMKKASEEAIRLQWYSIVYEVRTLIAT